MPPRSHFGSWNLVISLSYRCLKEETNAWQEKNAWQLTTCRKSTSQSAFLLKQSRISTAMSGISTTKSKYPPDWVSSVIASTYNDGEDVMKGLDNILGTDRYALKYRNGCWVVWAWRKLNKVSKHPASSHS
ncbi:hypothetical protein F4804DRAFT_321930, partial [Jackrogersella minutella]